MPQRKPGENAISRVLLGHQRVADQLVAGAVEVAAPIEQVVGRSRARSCELRLRTARAPSRSARSSRDRRAAGSRTPAAADSGSRRPCPPCTSRSSTARNLPLLPALVTSVRAAAIARRATGCGTPSCVCPPRIASMPRHARGELEVDVHAVVRQQHDDLRALAARLVDDLLQVLFLDAERPLRRRSSAGSRSACTETPGRRSRPARR